jgi:hypothetical protein
MRFCRRVPPPPHPPSASPSGTAAISPSSSPSHSHGLAFILSCLSTHHSSRRPWRCICAREDGASVMRKDGTEADLGSRLLHPLRLSTVHSSAGCRLSLHLRQTPRQPAAVGGGLRRRLFADARRARARARISTRAHVGGRA